VSVKDKAGISSFANIAIAVRELRTKAGLSQEELSQLMGYKNGQFISNIERGICGIPMHSLYALVKHTNGDKDYIIRAIVGR
jgi:transcriptional regulator with XRE-family HTH domain